MAQQPNLDEYVDVRQRMTEFFEKHSQGSFQSEYQFGSIGERSIVIVKAYAYRDPDDKRPGIGLAYEYIPAVTPSGNRNPYVTDSEVQNAETAAWGRAVIAVGAGDSKKPITSRQEVRNRTTDEPTNVISNLEGQRELLALCRENGWKPEHIAARFESRFKRSPRDASNEDLSSFVNMVKSGIIQVELEPQPA